MGLLLSILVACVGVVELLAFYSNVRRSFVTTSTQTDLSDVSRKYWEELHRHRNNILNDLQAKGGTIKKSPQTYCNGNVTSAVLHRKEDLAENRGNGFQKGSDLPKFVTENHEEVAVLTKIASSSVQERRVLPKLVAEDDSLLSSEKESKALQNETVGEDLNKEVSKCVVPAESHSNVALNRFGFSEVAVVKDGDSPKDSILGQNGPVLPQFVVENPGLAQCSFGDDQEVYTKSRSISPIPRQFGDDYRRSPSPYPCSGVPVPRNSICSELLDNPTSLLEVDEESISPTPEKLLVVLENSHNTCQYWNNKMLVVPPLKSRFSDGRKRRSVSPNLQRIRPQLERRRRSKSASDPVEIEGYNERFLDSLDGVSKKKFSRHSVTRRSKRKKTLKSTSKDDVLSSCKNNESQTAKTLTEAANVLKNVNDGRGEAGCSKENKPAEPFWVNQ